MAIFLLFTGTLAPPPGARAAIWTVAPDGGGDFPTIQAAVDFAASGDEVLLEDGTFVGPGNVGVSFLGKILTVRSASGDRDACVIDCQDATVSAFRFVTGETPATRLEDLTIQGARGAALHMGSASPTVRNVVLRNNYIPAVNALGGSPLISGCLLEANTVPGSNAKGVVHGESAVLTVEDTEFRSNGGPWGSAADACITSLMGGAMIRRCDFSGSADNPLSIFASPSASPRVIEDCSFDGDVFLHTSYGSSQFDVRRCTIQGGGVTVSGTSTVTVEDCEIRGAAVGYWDEFSTGTSTLRNVLVESCLTGLKLGAPTADVQGCTIRGNNYVGLQVSQGAVADIRDCLITGNGITGVNSWSSSPVTVERCTIAANGDCCGTLGGGVASAGTGLVTVRRTILWGGCRFDGTPMDVFAQTGASIDLQCVLLDPSRVSGPGTVTITNAIAEDPLFCSPLLCTAAPTSAGIYAVAANSPALSQACGTIGAPGPTCDAVGVEAELEARSWGRIKAGYGRARP